MLANKIFCSGKKIFEYMNHFILFWYSAIKDYIYYYGIAYNVIIMLEEMKYLVFSSLRSDVEVKCGVEFRHLTHNASKIRW